MSTPARSSPPPPARRAPMIAAGVLLLIPLIALTAVPTYAKVEPRWGGFPFFIWYQLCWVLITAGCTSTAFILVRRARAHQPAATVPGDQDAHRGGPR